jgi:hypothetical protein
MQRKQRFLTTDDTTRTDERNLMFSLQRPRRGQGGTDGTAGRRRR